MTSFVTDLARERLEAFLDSGLERALEEYANIFDLEMSKLQSEYPEQATRWDWYANSIASEGHGSSLDTAQQALEILSGMKALSQAMGEYNPALVMRRQARQLPVEDTMGFPE